MKMTGAKIFIEALKKEGVEIMFGYPGGVVLPIFDALYDSGINFILTRHEQGAAHAADGYARATGKVGVCLATSGPGATNLVTGLATANMDSVPIVAFTGQVRTSLIGNDAFQEVDISGITRPISKHNYLVKDINKLATVIKNAFHIASTGRPGVVVVDIPVDIQIQEADFYYPESIEIRGYKPTYNAHIGQIKRACKLIAASKKPVLYVGGGVIISNASGELIEFVKKTEIPVTMTLMGLGAFPGTDKFSLGMLGMHGTAYANHAIHESDLIIAIGARFDDRVTGKIEEFAPHAKIIHIDIDPCAISKNVEVDIPIVGDAKCALRDLLKNVEKPDISGWHKQIEVWKKKYPLTYKDDSKLRPQYVVEEIYNVTKGNAIITTEVGQNQMWAAQ
ncbi:MAG: biosynthetic-type acetolactate synthase large subunit, partial [Candidatus Omnitrophica bacterium]|nr:biosynthetic-type acetolactate synthase large subunit [Candidatus Omnitrophota bacterium]